MECAEPSSHLGTQSRKTFPVCRLREAPGSTIVPSHGAPADLAEPSTRDSSWAVDVGIASGFLPVSLSKTPRIEFLFLCTRSLPDASPIKASDQSSGTRPNAPDEAKCCLRQRATGALCPYADGRRARKIRKSLTCGIVL